MKALSATKIRLASVLLLSIAAHVLLIGAVLTWLARPPVYPVVADAPPWIVQLVPPPRRVTSPAVRSPRSTRPVPARPTSSAVSAISEVVGPPTGAEAADGAATRERVRQALRRSAAGCANADLVGLNRQERNHCYDSLGKNMAQIQRAMREAEQSRLSTGGRPPSVFAAFMAACRASREGERQQSGVRDGLC